MQDTVRDYGGCIWLFAQMSTSELMRLSESVSGHKFDVQTGAGVIFGFITLSVHLTDRFLFGNVDETMRGEVFDNLSDFTLSAFVRNVVETEASELQDAKDDWMPAFSKMILKYAKYDKLYPGKGESPDGTLIGEFGKMVANEAGQKDKELEYIVACSKLVAASLAGLDVRAFIQKLKQQGSNR